MHAKISINLFFGLLAIAWLMPNHYLPWTAFHSDWMAFMALIAGFFVLSLNKSHIKIPKISILFAIASTIPILQYSFNIIYFHGDAIIATLYLLAACFAGILGFNTNQEDIYKKLSITVISVGLLSMWIAMTQWLTLDGYGIYFAQMQPGGRAYANFAQPNQFATFLSIGIAGTYLLYKEKYIHSSTSFALVMLFCFGITLSQSRSGFMEILSFLCWGFFNRKRDNKILIFSVITFAIFIFTWFFLIRIFDDFLLLSSIRADQLEGGKRPIHWATAIHAIYLNPIFGYGWNQVSVALSQTVNFYPATQEFLEHSHNIILDIFLWNGITIAIVIIAFAIYWLYENLLSKKRTALTVSIAPFLIFPVIHSFFEFPLEYTYLLIPCIFIAGNIERISKKSIEEKCIEKSTVNKKYIILSVSAFFLACYIGTEYIKIENNTRLANMENLGILIDGNEINIDEIKILNQQKQYLKYIRTQARKNMRAEEINWMRMVSERYGYAPALFRYAIALGLNNQTQEVFPVLQRICKTSSNKNCLEMQENWELMRQKYPELPPYIN